MEPSLSSEKRIRLEDYLRTTPAAAGNAVNDEADDSRAEQALPAAPVAGEVSEYECSWLKLLQNEPGYLIVFKMLNNIVEGFQVSATLQSQGDPLGNSQAVANAWAYVAIGRRIQHRLIMDIDAAVAKAKEKNA